MFCGNCGKELSEGACFCPYCGKSCAKINTEVNKDKSTGKKNYKKLSISLIIVIIVLVILYVGFLSTNKKIVGRWSNNECEVEYTDDGRIFVYSLDGECMKDGKWEVSGDTLSLITEDPFGTEKEDYTITHISRQQMILEKWNENTEEYKEYIFYKE